MSGSDLKLSKQQEDVALALKIKNDLNDYFKFVSLTEKKRSPRHTRLIEEYIKRESNITQRIHFIEELDREEQFAHKMGPAIDSDDIKKLKQKEQAKKKKKKISRSSFLTYLFSGRKDIKNFGARTNILKSGLFSIRITGDSEHYYKTLLSRVTTLLLKATNFMVENSWKSLNRTSYNVIITFSRFLKRFIQEGNIFALQDPISIFSKMEKYIIPYLQVASKRVNKDLLKEAFYETLYFEAAFKADFREIIHVVNELLDIDSRGMRFFNVILGTFMIQFRHFVSLPHMLNHYNVPEIDDSHYDFSPKIKGQIQEEIESGSYKFREMEEGLYYLRFIDESFNFSAPLENPVVQVFGRVFFYTRTKPPMTFEKLVTSGDFHDEAFLGSFKANITPVLYNYLIGFLTIFGPFLRGQVSVKGKDNLTHEVSLFSNWYFGKELEELANYQSELGALKDATTFLSIPYETYERFNRSGRIDLEKEERLCRHFQNVVGLIYKLSEKMSNALYRHFASSNLTGDEKLALETSKNDPIDDESLDARLIPHATSHIARDPYLEGQLIINVMNEIMAFSANFANLFRYADLSDRLMKKQKQLLKSEDYLKLKSKLAD